MNIQRHASRPSQSSSAAPPAAVASSWSDSSAAKMPSVIASCCSDPSRPRIAAGAISAMYAGAMTDAMPMPMPAMMRHSDQVPDAEREAGQDRGDEEQDRAEEHHAGAAPAVRELAAQPRAEGAAEQGDRDDEAR